MNSRRPSRRTPRSTGYCRWHPETTATRESSERRQERPSRPPRLAHTMLVLSIDDCRRLSSVRNRSSGRGVTTISTWTVSTIADLAAWLRPAATSAPSAGPAFPWLRSAFSVLGIDYRSSAAPVDGLKNELSDLQVGIEDDVAEPEIHDLERDRSVEPCVNCRSRKMDQQAATRERAAAFHAHRIDGPLRADWKP
jgi:hypothetical protein